jgi:hypothetical protein
MKFIAFLSLFFVGALLGVQAQSTGQHIRLLTNVELDGQKFFKGEVFPVEVEDKETKQYGFRLMGKMFTLSADQAQVLNDPPSDFSSKSAQIVTFDKSNMIISVDVSAISTELDTCRIVTSSGLVILLAKNKKVGRPPIDFGERFRVCIPGALPLLYETRQLLGDPKPANAAAAPDANASAEPTGSSFPLLAAIALGVAVLAAAGAGAVFFKSKNDRQALQDRIDHLQAEVNRMASSLSSLQQAGGSQKGSFQGNDAQKASQVGVQFALSWVSEAISFLECCDRVFSKAEQLLHEQREQYAASQLLTSITHPAYEAIRRLPTSHWAQLLQEMQSKGITTDATLVSAFTQLKNDETRKAELERLFLKQVGAPYASQALILIESMCHLGHLHIDGEVAAKAKTAFGDLGSALEANGRRIGIREYRTVALRSAIAGQPQWLQLQPQAPTPPFGAPRGHVAQILKIGIVTPDEPNPTTTVLEGLD